MGSTLTPTVWPVAPGQRRQPTTIATPSPMVEQPGLPSTDPPMCPPHKAGPVNNNYGYNFAQTEPTLQPPRPTMHSSGHMDWSMPTLHPSPPMPPFHSPSALPQADT